MSSFPPSFPRNPTCIRIGRVVFPHYSLPHFLLSLCALCASVASPVFSSACCLLVAPKNANSFAIKQIQALLPKHPGWGTLCDLCAPISVPSVLCFFLDVTCFHQPAASCSLLPLFFALAPFVFSTLQPLLRKTGGWGWVW